MESKKDFPRVLNGVVLNSDFDIYLGELSYVESSAIKLVRICRCYQLMDWQVSFFVTRKYISIERASGKSFIFMLMYTIGEIDFDELIYYEFHNSYIIHKSQIMEFSKIFKNNNEIMIEKLKDSGLSLVDISSDLKKWRGKI